MYFGFRQIAMERFGSRRDKRRIVPAPYNQSRRFVLAQPTAGGLTAWKMAR
jgi:hypothetical protein